MPKFQYKVKRGGEGVTTGVMEAESQRAVVSQLRDMGFFPIAVEEYAESQTSRPTLKRSVTRIRLKDRNWFFRQLANLLQSGMPILRALGTLRDQTANPKLHSVIDELYSSVQQGSSFAEALERHPRVFPPMYANLVKAGEAGGMLDEVLWRIVAFGEQDEELRGKAFSAMIYPAFLTIVSTVAVFILVSFVFPNFIEVFQDFDARLPAITVFVIGLSSFMGAYWWVVAIAIVLAGVGFNAYRRTPGGRRRLDALWLRLPVLGGLVQRYEMAKFARTLGTLFDNGVPVLSSLKITADTLNNTMIKEDLVKVHDSVSEGGSISDGLRRSPHFPPLVVNIFAVGEESGRLGDVTKRLADAYDVEVDRAVKAFTALLEPMIIVVMGVIIGFLVIAMLLPMLTLSAQVR